MEKSITVSKNTWFHVALRFNDRTVSIFINGSLVQTGSINEEVVGFSMYDDNMFGSSVFYDNIRLYDGALSATDIGKDKSGASDKLVQNWCTPFRINPYDGKDGVGINTVDVEYAKSSSNTTAPTSGWQTTAPAWEDGKYIWSRTKTVLTDGSTEYTKAVCITGGKGATGSPGSNGVGVKSIVEQYYLSSSPTSQSGGSWSTTRPTWKDKWYIWTRSVITYTNGTSDTTAAICVTGSKGDKGEDGKPGDKGEKGDSPVLVYRGIYDSSKTYYGNSKRLDAVKYNNQYYIVRIDAGTFSNVTPTTTSKWNTFGAQFETIATNLLLAEGANIGDWFIKGGKIVSTMGNGNRVELDASMARIYIESSSGGGDYALVDFGAKMTIDANRGIFETRAKNAPNYSNAVSYMSPTGIFSNMAGTDGMPASSGYTHRGAIVGLGFANVPARTWAINAVDTIVAGVYGRASNSGTAPAFGGFFYDLFAGGLILVESVLQERRITHGI